MKQTAPDIKYAHLRSDNAGCYHSVESLLSFEQLFKETGVWIKSIDFSDPQSGKGPCDRMAAVIKCPIRRFINEKNNCTDAIEFLTASGNLLRSLICSTSYIVLERTKGVEFHACELENCCTEKIEWTGVKQINNLEYIQGDTTNPSKTLTKVIAWQSWKIGSGKVYFEGDLQQTIKKITPLNVIRSTNIDAPWITDSYEKEGIIIFLL